MTSEARRFDFTDGHAELTPRSRHLHVVEHGFVGSVENMGAYLDHTLALAKQHGLAHVLVDTRDTSLPSPGEARWKDIRELRWRRVAESGLTFAFVVADDIAATRVSMTARGSGAHARGFVDVAAAMAWLFAK
jgi:hypothetical protein